MNHNNKKGGRFTSAERWGHGIHAAAFLLLFLTGSSLLFQGFGGLLGSGILGAFRSIHHFMAWLFTFLPVIVLLAGAPGKTADRIKECLSWSKRKANAGKKINTLFTVFIGLLMVVTGWMMMLADHLPEGAAAWALAFHSLGAMSLGAVVLWHVYARFLAIRVLKKPARFIFRPAGKQAPPKTL